MAQHFCTFYDRTMRWPQIDRRKPYKPYEEHFEKLPHGDMWQAPAKTDREALKVYKTEELKEFVHRMYWYRLRSTYRVSYGRDDLEPPGEDSFTEPAQENELLEYGRRIFTERKKKNKILKPMATSKKLFGYMRGSRMYTGLSEYQDVIDRQGYIILEENESQKRQRETG